MSKGKKIKYGELIKCLEEVWAYDVSRRCLICLKKDQICIFIKKEIDIYSIFIDNTIANIYYVGTSFIGFLFKKL